MSANLPLPSLNENVSTVLSTGITDVAATMDVADASLIVSPCYLVIDQHDSSGALRTTNFWEYVKVTNVGGNTLTITRAQGGSTGQAHSAGAVVEAVVTSSMFEDWYAALNPEHTSTGGHVITGTMTIAGMNLASVATIAKASIGILNIITNVNASGASIVGWPSTSGTGGFNALFQVPGSLASQVDIAGLVPVPTAFTAQFMQAYVKTPASLSSIGIFINKNGAAWGTVQILGGSTFASSASFSSTALVSSDVLTLDIKSNASLSRDLSVLLRAI